MAEIRFLWEDGRIPLYNASYGDFKPYIELHLLQNGRGDNP